MAMGRDGYEYCLPNPLLRLPNISPYPYPIPDGYKFIVPSRYPSGTRRVLDIPDPIPYTIQIRKIFFFVKKILKI